MLVDLFKCGLMTQGHLFVAQAWSRWQETGACLPCEHGNTCKLTFTPATWHQSRDERQTLNTHHTGKSLTQSYCVFHPAPSYTVTNNNKSTINCGLQQVTEGDSR